MPQPTEDLQVEAVPYNEEELAYRSKIIQRLEKAKRQRDATHPELDDMDYLTYYETNAKAANSYIPPKENKDDTRLVTGTTHEKTMTLLSAILNYNLEPSIEAYDNMDFPIMELGDHMGDLVKKSREIEDWDSKKPLIYKEFLDQGDCFVEEVWTQQFRVEKTLKMDWAEGVKMNAAKWESDLKKAFEGCQANLLAGTKVFKGNVKQLDIRKQPFVATVESMPYAEFMSIYGKWERAKYVPRKIRKEITTSDNIQFADWTLIEQEEDMVELIKYQDKWGNEFMIMANGVMMLPIKDRNNGFPLTAISPSGEYTIVQGSCEPISQFFAYSKSVPAKSKVDQQVLDEMIKLIVLKTQQSFKPPMANNTKKVLSKRIFSPGHIQNDIDPDKLKPILGNMPMGVQPAEFSAFQLIKQIVDEKTVSPVFSGDQSQGNQTATEILEMKKQQMMKLGLVIWGIINLEKQLTWLRIYNIMANWTKPIDKRVDDQKKQLQDVYRSITVNTTFDNGVEGQKVINFDPQLAQTLTPDQVQAQEGFMSRELQTPVRVVYLDPQKLSTLKANWYIVITPTEKNTSDLQRVLFVNNIKEAAMIFGVQSLNMDYLKERFAVLAKEDPEKFWVKGQPAMPMMPGAQPGAGQGQPDMGAEMMKSMQGAGQPTPTLNTLAAGS